MFDTQKEQKGLFYENSADKKLLEIPNIQL